MCGSCHVDAATHSRDTPTRDIPRSAARLERRRCPRRSLRGRARRLSCLGVVTPGSTALSDEYRPKVVAVCDTESRGALSAAVGTLPLPVDAHDPRVQFSEPATDPTSTHT